MKIVPINETYILEKSMKLTKRSISTYCFIKATNTRPDPRNIWKMDASKYCRPAMLLKNKIIAARV